MILPDNDFWSERPYNDPRQTSFVFFWPLTEQIPLDLDYEGCNTKVDNGLSYSPGSGLCLSTNGITPSWTTVSNIQPQLSITPIDSKGELSIGGINLGMEKKPNIFQRVIFKLLGFNWKDYESK